MARLTSSATPGGLVGLALAAAIGLGAGVTTSYLQGVLSSSANFLANSGAVWSLVSYGAALALRRRAIGSAIIGFLTLFGEVLGYYAVACPIRHVPTSTAEWVEWSLAAAVIGPFVGYLAWWSLPGPEVLRLCAIGAVCGMVVGEGLHALIRLSYTGQGAGECAVGVGAYAVCALTIGKAWWVRAAGMASGAVVALLVFVAYAVG